MFRPSMYNKHDDTMNYFAALFHDCPECGHIEMRPNQIETYDNDGTFVDLHTDRSIGYDWEYRDRHFKNCNFAFPTLGQYERKIIKPSIQLSIQCDSTVTGIAVGWHNDWFLEQREKRALLTDYAQKEDGTIRYTKKFKIYSFAQMASFKRMIAYALKENVYSSEAFFLGDEGGD